MAQRCIVHHQFSGNTMAHSSRKDSGNDQEPRKVLLDWSTYSPTPAALCEAAREGDTRAIDRILAHRPELLTVDNPYQWTRFVEGHETRGSYNKKPVEVAAFFDQVEAVAKLLEISRDSHAIQKPWEDHLPFDGLFNSLNVARVMRHANVVSAIESEIWYRIDARPNLLNQACHNGSTVLDYAAEQGHMPLVRALLERGADPDPPLKSGKRVIHRILGSPMDGAQETPEQHLDRLAVARLLVEHGAEIDLWIAAAIGDKSRVLQILSADASQANQHFRPDAKGYSAGFPLVQACYRGHVEIVNLLLDHKADVNCDLGVEDPPEFGYALVAALEGQQFDTVELLLDRGASIDAHGSCVPPFVDELYAAAMVATGRRTTHQQLANQPLTSETPAAIRLYQRVLAMGGETRNYTFVTQRDHAEIKLQLERLPIESPGARSSEQRKYDAIVDAAAWQGDADTIDMCFELRPSYHSSVKANQMIGTAIRSHNRMGSFQEYRRIIELNLKHLRANDAPITAKPIWRLAAQFLHNYRYGDTPDMPCMPHLLELAALFLEYGADVNQLHKKTGHTALTKAIDCGYLEYVDFLLKHGATLESPADVDAVTLARKHGFERILQRLGVERGDCWSAIDSHDQIPLQAPSQGAAAITMAPFANAIIRLGAVTLENELEPVGKKGDTASLFVEFPEPFPAAQFANVRMIVSNRNHPQVIASATTGLQNGKQGFLLKARHSFARDDKNEKTVAGASFSWLALLLTDSAQPEQVEARFGMVPYRAFKGREHHLYTDTDALYADHPFDSQTGAKHVFLTTTESNVINGAASLADERGIRDLEAFQVSRHDGGGRIYWMVLAERTADTLSTNQDNAGNYFDSSNLWLHASRETPVEFPPAGFPGAWRNHWTKFLRPFRERRPCVFVTANRHDVVGHHAGVLAMSWDSTSKELPVMGLNLDPHRGQSNFDTITIGHCDCTPDEIAEANRQGLSIDEPWERFAAVDGCDQTAYEFAASGAIGVNEFGPQGASLLTQAVYERHERVNTALARRLFALGTDPNQRTPTTHVTPLHLAAYLGREDMARLLIERGADVNATIAPGSTSIFPSPYELSRIRRAPIPTHRGETPLHLSMLQPSLNVALILLEAGAEPNAEDVNGDRPIDYLPSWSATPDDPNHWRLINRRAKATRNELREVIKSMLE